MGADLLDVTVILLTCSYRDQEFIRIGYYVHNEYSEQVDEHTQVNPDKILRNILHDKPRVTRFQIAWDGSGLPQTDINGKMCATGGDEDDDETKENDVQYQDEEEEENEEEEEDLEDDDDLAEEDLEDT